MIRPINEIIRLLYCTAIMHLCVYNHGYETIHIEDLPNLLQNYAFLSRTTNYVLARLFLVYYSPLCTAS